MIIMATPDKWIRNYLAWRIIHPDEVCPSYMSELHYFKNNIVWC